MLTVKRVSISNKINPKPNTTLVEDKIRKHLTWRSLNIFQNEGKIPARRTEFILDMKKCYKLNLKKVCGSHFKKYEETRIKDVKHKNVSFFLKLFIISIPSVYNTFRFNKMEQNDKQFVQS